MKTSSRAFTGAVVLLCAVGLTTAALWAQRGQGAGAPAAEGGRGTLPPAGPVPRLANGKPDLSGHWANPYTPNMALRAVDPKMRQPLKFARQGEALPDAVAPASGSQPRTYDLPRVNLTNRQMKGTFFLSLVLIPALMALVGIAVWWRQR